MRVRLLALANVALIPYVWARFPREARSYTRRSFRSLLAAWLGGARLVRASDGRLVAA